MKENQKGIYWIPGESDEAVMNSPMLEYSDHKLTCITKENSEINESEEEKGEFEGTLEINAKHLVIVKLDEARERVRG